MGDPQCWRARSGPPPARSPPVTQSRAVVSQPGSHFAYAGTGRAQSRPARGHRSCPASCSSPRCATPTRCPQVCPWSDPARGSRQLCQHGGTLAATTASMSDFWHKLGCCVVEKPQPKKRRRRIDRSMIGEPMNFVHLTHIGSGDMAAGEGLPMTGAVQEMRSKGGRERQWSNSRVL
ncbi:CDC42 small effector protein 1 isoform 1-T1 [Cyanocitta cristata]